MFPVTAIEVAVTPALPLLFIALPLFESTMTPHAALTEALPVVLKAWLAVGCSA